MGTYDHSAEYGLNAETNQTVSLHHDEFRTVVRLEGHLDIHTAPPWIEHLKSILHAPIERLEIDMGQLRFIDSAGLRSLLWLHAAARTKEIDVRVIAISPVVKGVLELAGLRETFAPQGWPAEAEYEWTPEPETTELGNLIWRKEGERAAGSGARSTPTGRKNPANSLREQSTEVGVDVYLDTDDDDEIDVVMTEVDQLVRTLGYESTAPGSIERGSIFKRWKARSPGTLSSDEMRRRLAELEQALSIRLVQKDRAEVTSVEADAMARLIDSLTPIPCACIRINDYVVVKVQQDEGPVVSSRKLNDTELRAVEKYPEIQKTPDKFFDLLATAIDELDPPDEINPATATG